MDQPKYTPKRVCNEDTYMSIYISDMVYSNAYGEWGCLHVYISGMVDDFCCCIHISVHKFKQLIRTWYDNL